MKEKPDRAERRRRFREQVRENPRLAAVYFILRLLVILMLVAQAFNHNFENVFLCVLTLFLFTLPSFLERKIRIDIPNTLEIIILLFIFAAEILGEIRAYYVTFPYWDTMLHTLWGFLAAGIGFALADILNRSQASRLQLTPIYMAITAFCFSMTIGALWELFEYTMDTFVGFDMQKDTIVAAFSSVTLDPTNSNVAIHVGDIVSTTITTASGETVVIPNGYLDIGIHDSMADIFVNMCGAIVFSIIGFAYVKNRNNGSKKNFAANFIPRLREIYQETRHS